MIVLFIVLLLGLVPVDAVWAQQTKPTVAQRVNDVNVFNKVSDFAATVGKSKKEKAQILEIRKEERRLQRLRDLQAKKQKRVSDWEKQLIDEQKNVKGLREGYYTDQ